MQRNTSSFEIVNEDNRIEVQYQDGDVIFGNFMTQNQRFANRSIDMIKILALQEGSAQFMLNGKMYRMEEGDLIYISQHSNIEDLLATPGAKVQFLCVRAGIMTTFFQAPTFLDLAFSIYQHPLLHFNGEEKHRMEDLVQAMEHFVHKGYPFERQIISKILEAYIYFLLGHYQRNLADKLPHQDTPTKASSMDTIFRKFMALLGNQEVKPRNVKYYSDQLNITPKYLSACCLKSSGMSCFAHINQAVINDIKKYLRQPDISYKEIAYKLGFPNHSFFSKYVREHLGYTPTQYRNKYLKELAQQVKPEQ